MHSKVINGLRWIVAEIHEDVAIIEYLEFHGANRNDIDDVNDDDNSSVDI